MSIGITQRPIQNNAPALDYSALSGNNSPLKNPQGEQNTPQGVDPGALLFSSDKQKDVNFGPPDNTVQNPQDKSKTGDQQSDLIQLLSALITSLLQMLMKSGDKQEPNEQQDESQEPFQNNNGLGTQLADSGDNNITPDAGGGSGEGETPDTAGGGGGGGNGGSQPTASGADKGGGGYVPDASGGVAPPVSTQLANPNRKTDSGSAPDLADLPKAADGATVVNETIKVGPGQTFDGHNQTFTAGAKLGNGDQSEDQKPLFELAEGATLKNVILGKNEADGVHVVAANEKPVTVDNVHWTDVGEDALTVKPEGGADVTNLKITNSSAENANDKIFQLNANAHVELDKFEANYFGTLMRTNGEKQFDNMDLKLNDVVANHGKFALVKSDSENLKLTTSNIAMTDVKHAYDKTKASTQHTEL